MVIKTDVTEVLFKTVGACDIYLDVHLPTKSLSHPLPVLLWFHGGGLLQGSRKSVTQHMLAGVEAQQYCLIAADYRLAPQATVADIVDDALDAVRFIRRQLSFRLATATLYTTDIAVSGSSAGGYLALLVALRDPKLRSCLAIYPITDPLGDFFTNPQTTPEYDASSLTEYIDPTSQLMSSTEAGSPRTSMYYHMMATATLAGLLHLFDSQSGDDSRYIVASEIRQTTKDASIPPIYIVHGNADTKVGVEQSHMVRDALSERQAQVVYEELEGLDHGFDHKDDVKLTAMYDFLNSHWAHKPAVETIKKSAQTATSEQFTESSTNTSATDIFTESHASDLDTSSGSESGESTVSLSSYASDDADEQWAQQMHELSLALNLILLPLVGKYFGRQFALWGWAKFIVWRTPFEVVRDKKSQRVGSAILAWFS